MYSIRETFVFQTEIYTFRIFIPSLCCFFFLSLPRWVSVFFPARSARTCRCHGKWSFFGSSVFLVVKNPYDLRSKIRFWILPKKLKPTRSLWVNVRLRLRLLTGGLSWGTQSVFARGVLSSPLLPPPNWKTRRPWGRGWTFYVDIHRTIAMGYCYIPRISLN